MVCYTKLSHYIGTFRVFVFVFVYSNYIPVFVKYRFMARSSSQIYKLKGLARGTSKTVLFVAFEIR